MKLRNGMRHDSEGSVTRIPQTFLPGLRMDLLRDLERIIARTPYGVTENAEVGSRWGTPSVNCRSASEERICGEFVFLGFNRILMDPSVRVTYERSDLTDYPFFPLAGTASEKYSRLNSVLQHRAQTDDRWSGDLKC